MIDSIIDFSPEAKSAKAIFYEKSFTVFVEADHDAAYWECIFKLSGIDSGYFEPVGGSGRLDDLITEIEAVNASYLVCRDRDVLGWLGRISASKKVVYSHGYSIENSLFHPSRISKVASVNCSKIRVKSDINDLWIDSLVKSFQKILVFQYIVLCGTFRNIGLPNSIQAHLESKHSYYLSSVKVSAWVDEKLSQASKAEVDEASNFVSKLDGYELWYAIKGHLLKCLVVQRIKGLVREVCGKSLSSLPHDNLYSFFLPITHDDLELDCIQKELADIRIAVTQL